MLRLCSTIHNDTPRYQWKQVIEEILKENDGFVNQLFFVQYQLSDCMSLPPGSGTFFNKSQQKPEPTVQQGYLHGEL